MSEFHVPTESELPAGVSAEAFGVDGRPGLRLQHDSEYAIAQELSNGFTVTWTTRQTPATALANCGNIDAPGFSATVVNGAGMQSIDSPGIVDYLGEHKCSWVKLRKSGLSDYVVYVAGDGLNELAALGPDIHGFVDNDKKRVEHLYEMMDKTASDALHEGLRGIFPHLVRVIEASA